MTVTAKKQAQTLPMAKNEEGSWKEKEGCNKDYYQGWEDKKKKPVPKKPKKPRELTEKQKEAITECLPPPTLRNKDDDGTVLTNNNHTGTKPYIHTM